MDTNLINRRQEWLKLSQEDYSAIKPLYETYLVTEIKKYAEYELAKVREKKMEAEANRIFSKWLKFLIWIVLAALGVTIFTVLPSVIAEQTGASDSVAQVARSIGGIILVFLGHYCVSSLLKEILIYIEYKTLLKQLEDKRISSKLNLEIKFLEFQIDCAKKLEGSFARFPSMFVILFAIVASLAEIGGLIFIFKEDPSVSMFLIAILCIVPLFLLWAISFVTAYYEKVPKVNKDILEIYINKKQEIQNNYTDIKNKDINDTGNSSLNKMQELFFNELEKKESIIDYSLDCLRLGNSKRNELIKIEGEIEYYKNVQSKLENENSHRQRNTVINNTKMKNQDYSHYDFEPNGEGSTQFQIQQKKMKNNNEQQEKVEVEDNIANSIINQCIKKIEDLTTKLQKCENSP